MKVYVLVFLCCLGDAVSTAVGLSRGFVETNPFFFPFFSFLVLAPVLFLISRVPLRVHSDFKELVDAGLVLVALCPVLNNLMLISGLRFL